MTPKKEQQKQEDNRKLADAHLEQIAGGGVIPDDVPKSSLGVIPDDVPKSSLGVIPDDVPNA